MGLSQAEKDELELLELEEQEAQYQASKKPEAKDSGFSPRAALEGLGQSASLGYLNNIKAATEPLSAGIYNALTGNDVEADDYVTARDGYNKQGDKLREENPASYYGGMGAGALLTAPAMPGFSAAKGAGALAKVGAAAKTGVAYGAAANPGDVAGEISPVQAAPRIMNAGIGGLIGGGIQGGIEGGAKLGSMAKDAIGNGSRNMAKRLAARSLGLERGTIKKLGADQVDEIGAYALDNKIISPFGSADDMLSRNEDVITTAMDARSKAYQTIDDAGASAFNPLEAASEVEGKVVGGMNRDYDDTQEIISALDPHLSNILSRGEKNISMVEAQKLVESLGKKAKFDTSRNNTANDVAVDAYIALREALNKAAELGSDRVGVSGLRGIIEKANKQYSTGLKAKSLLDNKFAREQGNKILGLTDTITVAETAGSLGGPKAAAILAAKRAGERFGSSTAAVGLDKLSKALLKSPQMAEVYQSNPAAFQAIAAKLSERMPEFARAADKPEAQNFNQKTDKQALLQKTQGSKYQQVLANAAKNGDQSFNAAYYVLHGRDASFRRLVDGEGK